MARDARDLCLPGSRPAGCGGDRHARGAAGAGADLRGEARNGGTPSRADRAVPLRRGWGWHGRDRQRGGRPTPWHGQRGGARTGLAGPHHQRRRSSSCPDRRQAGSEPTRPQRRQTAAVAQPARTSAECRRSHDAGARGRVAARAERPAGRGGGDDVPLTPGGRFGSIRREALLCAGHALDRRFGCGRIASGRPRPRALEPVVRAAGHGRILTARSGHLGLRPLAGAGWGCRGQDLVAAPGQAAGRGLPRPRNGRNGSRRASSKNAPRGSSAAKRKRGVG